MLEISGYRCFDGEQLRFQHYSHCLNCSMRFSLYLPPQARDGRVPALIWLSGFTCTDENFAQKAGAQRYAAEQGIALVMPDTSPRGEQVSTSENQCWSYGLAASFYLDATETPWRNHYQMASYITGELPELLREFPIRPTRFALAGHGMGGHGALTLGLKHPALFASISAFAPIAAPSSSPWGEMAFRQYLGGDKSRWAEHDACALIARGTHRTPLRVDQGLDDAFAEDELRPSQLQSACDEAHHPLDLRYHPGYDHSYYFIASFIESHIRYHAEKIRD